MKKYNAIETLKNLGVIKNHTENLEEIVLSNGLVSQDILLNNQMMSIIEMGRDYSKDVCFRDGYLKSSITFYNQDIKRGFDFSHDGQVDTNYNRRSRGVPNHQGIMLLKNTSGNKSFDLFMALDFTIREYKYTKFIERVTTRTSYSLYGEEKEDVEKSVRETLISDYPLSLFKGNEKDFYFVDEYYGLEHYENYFTKQHEKLSRQRKIGTLLSNKNN